MPKIYKYQKIVDAYTTHCLAEPDYNLLETADRITELCTIGADTYVSVPDSIVLPAQPEEITLEEVTLTDELIAELRAASPHVTLINDRVVAKIRERYSLNDEIKALGLGRCTETEMYYSYVDACRAWGKVEKGKLLGPPLPSEVAADAAQTTKVQAVRDNLPSWQAVSAAIDAATTISKLQAIVKKMARVQYWLAKGTET